MSGNSQEVSRDLYPGTEQKLSERKNDVFISFLPFYYFLSTLLLRGL